MKNRELTRINIQEAREQLQEIEKSLLDNDYDEVELRIELEHAYHHLNYAWNIRNASDEELKKSTKEHFAKYSKYPKKDILEWE